MQDPFYPEDISFLLLDFVPGSLRLKFNSNLGDIVMAAPNQRPIIDYGFTQALQQVFPIPIVAKRAPTTSDKAQLGTLWIQPTNTSGTAVNGAWILTSIIANLATWSDVSEGSGMFTSLTVNPGPTNLSTVGNGAVTIGNSTNTGLIQVSAGSGGVSFLGNGNSITIGTDSAANTVALGSVTNGALTTINGGNGTGLGSSAVQIGTAAAGDIQIGLATQTGTIRLGTSTAGQTVDIGTGAGANTLVMGSTNTTSATTVQAGTGGLALSAAGAVSMVPATSSGVSTTPTLNSRVGVVTVTGLTTANAGGSQVITITNNKVLTTSGVFVTLTHLNASTNGATLRIEDVTIAANTIAVKYSNNGAGALGAGDNVLISFWVIS